MDIKVPNVTAKIMTEALEQARHGRLYIIDKMEEAIAAAARQHVAIRAAYLHHQHSDR